MIAALLALSLLGPAQVGTSTAATYQAATVECIRKLKNANSRATTSAEELELARARVVEAKAEAAHRVSRGSRAWSVAGASTLAAGFAVSILGPVLCRSPTCRELLGIGGGTAVILGASVTVLAW